jgi:hypothetical protein
MKSFVFQTEDEALKVKELHFSELVSMANKYNMTILQVYKKACDNEIEDTEDLFLILRRSYLLSDPNFSNRIN